MHLLLLLACLALPIHGSAAELALLLSDSSPSYGDFSNQLFPFAENSGWRIRWSGRVEQADNMPPVELIVAAGPEALRAALRLPGNTPIIGALLSRSSLDRILSESPRARAGTTAVLLDQPSSRVLAFASTLLPGARSAVILGSGENTALLNALRQSPGNRLKLETEVIGNDNTLLPTLNELLPRNDMLIALPDSQVYRRDNIRSILLTSFRHRKPMLGFSQAHVTAGALAALYISPGLVARQVGDLLGQLHTAPYLLPPPQMAHYYAIAINHTVAESMAFSLPDEATIRRIMSQTEGR